MKKSETRQLAVINQFKEMAHKLAWQYWRQLPAATKMWVDPEDLVAEAYIYILKRADETYDKSRASRSTFLWTGLTNLFINFALSQQTKKRFGWNVTLEQLDLMGIGKQDEGCIRVEAIDALLLTYNQASSGCREQMQLWFGLGKLKVRRTAAVKAVYREFMGLAEHNKLSPNDCRKLMRSGMWLS